MSDMIDNMRERWLALQPAARRLAWAGLTQRERYILEAQFEPPPPAAPAGCLSLLLPTRSPVPDITRSRLRLATPAYELELTDLDEQEFQTALNAVMLLVRGGEGATPTVEVAAEPAARERALRAELMQRRGNVGKLNLQLAVYARGEAPLHLLNQLEAEETRVAELERELDALHAEETTE